MVENTRAVSEFYSCTIDISSLPVLHEGGVGVPTSRVRVPTVGCQLIKGCNSLRMKVRLSQFKRLSNGEKF